MLVAQMGEADIDFETMDRRLGKEPGWSCSKLNDFITARTNDGREFTDLACGLGYEIGVSARQIVACDEAPSDSPAKPEAT